MTPPGKIIDIDAFKKKDESFGSRPKKGGGADPSGGLLAGRIDKPTALLLLVTTLFLTLIMAPSRRADVTPLEVDAIAPRNVRAAEELLIEDVASTAKNRATARRGVLDVYDLDTRGATIGVEQVRDAFGMVAVAYSTRAEHAYKIAVAAFDPKAVVDKVKIAEAKASLAAFESTAAFGALEKKFDEILGLTLTDRERRTLRHYHYWPQIGSVVGSAVNRAALVGVLPGKGDLPASTLKGISLRTVGGDAERKVTSFESLYDLPEARRAVASEMEGLIGDDRSALRRVATRIAAELVVPNVTYNSQETERRRDLAEEQAPPVYFKVKRGEMIVREGDRVTRADAAKLAYIAGRQESSAVFPIFAGLFLVTLTILTLAGVVVRKFHEEVAGNPTLQRLAALILAGHLFAVWAVARVLPVVSPVEGGIGADTFALAAPLIVGPMLVSIFFTVEFTVLFTLFAAAFTGLMLRDFSLAPLLTVIGGTLCAYQVGSYRRRSTVIKVGLLAAVAFVVTTLAYDMITAKFLSSHQLYDAASVFVGAGLAVGLTTLLTPMIESSFPVVSDIKLMELANPDHPLLRRMLMEAPGTYHHSMMVGYLAEEAAKQIEANPLLARAGAMFHDIGKLKKPAYFIENQKSGDNPHDRLAPSMSALIVVNHVKEGMELARQHKLLPQIAAMIPEHHGTTVIRYFYNKAKSAEDVTRGQAKEADYRYPGPIPSSKESACVALADSIEAAARACSEPTPLRLKGIVTDVVKDKFIQGQLDNSHLTLSDLSKIADAFVHVLLAIHHHRIQYPDHPKGERGRRIDDRSDIRPAPVEGPPAVGDA